MSQIIQNMAVVLPIWMLMMTTKIFVLKKLENIRSAVTASPLSQHLRMMIYIVSEFFEIGENLFLTNDGCSGPVKVKCFSLNKANILKIDVKNTNGDNIFTTNEHICSPYNPDIGWIPESAPEYGQAAKLLLE